MASSSLTPARVVQVARVSRSIFGSVGPHLAQYGPGKAPAGAATPLNVCTARSPRPLFRKKFKAKMLANYLEPFVRPQILSGRVARQEEAVRDMEDDKWDEEESAVLAEIAEKEGTTVKRAAVVLKKGKRKGGQ